VGIEVAGDTPEEFQDFIQSEVKKWAAVALADKITPEWCVYVPSWLLRYCWYHAATAKTVD